MELYYQGMKYDKENLNNNNNNNNNNNITLQLLNDYDTLLYITNNLSFNSLSSANIIGIPITTVTSQISGTGTSTVTSKLTTITGSVISAASSVVASRTSSSTSVLFQNDTNFENFLNENYLNDNNTPLYKWNNDDTLFCDDDGTNNSNYNDDNDDALSSTYFKTAVYLLYISIFLFALLGNGVVCYIVQSTPRMRTVTNYFICNLAVGDILMSLFCVPFSFVSIFILRYWPFGTILCHLVNYSQAVSVLVSAYTLVAISADRYTAIMWPLRPRITKRYAKCIIIIVWMIALITALPIPIVSRLEQPEGWYKECNKYICREEWPSQLQNYYYTLALLTLQFVIPLAVLVFTYTRIAIAVWGKRPPGEAENSRDQRMARSKRKMIKMMVTVVIVFTICWLPFNILVLLLNDEDFSRWEPLPYFWFAFHWLAMSHSCYNPIIYCYMNARFRGGFVQVLHRVPGFRRCWCVRKCARGRGGSTETGFALTGTDDTFHLQRINTCTTYISTRRKAKTNSNQNQLTCVEGGGTTMIR